MIARYLSLLTLLAFCPFAFAQDSSDSNTEELVYNPDYYVLPAVYEGEFGYREYFVSNKNVTSQQAYALLQLILYSLSVEKTSPSKYALYVNQHGSLPNQIDKDRGILPLSYSQMKSEEIGIISAFPPPWNEQVLKIMSYKEAYNAMQAAQKQSEEFTLKKEDRSRKNWHLWHSLYGFNIYFYDKRYPAHISMKYPEYLSETNHSGKIRYFGDWHLELQTQAMISPLLQHYSVTSIFDDTSEYD